MLSTHDLFGLLSLLLNASSGIPYIISTLRGKTRPHIFTWVLWALLSAIAAAAQQAGNAGPGAWTTWFSAALSVVTAVLAFSHGDRTITRGDWVSFIAALSIIPLWYVTKSPLTAAVLATLMDALGFYPTLRKSYHKPREELVWSYVAANLKHVAGIAATVEYSMTTLVYPAVMLFMNAWLIVLLLWRRHVLGRG